MHFITIMLNHQPLTLKPGNQADVLLPDVQKCLLFWNFGTKIFETVFGSRFIPISCGQVQVLLLSLENIN